MLIGGLIVILNLQHINPKYDVLKIISTKQNNFINMAEGGLYLKQTKNEKVVYIPDENRAILIPIDEAHFKIKADSMFFFHKVSEAQKSDEKTVYTAIFNQKKAGSLLNVKHLKPNLKSFAKETPKAFINTLFRPFLFESKSPLILLSGMENFLFIILLILVFFFKKRPSRTNVNLIYFSLTFALILVLFIGLTTPVMGSIVRYKAPALPFLFLSLFLLLDTKKTTSFFKKHFKYNAPD